MLILVESEAAWGGAFDGLTLERSTATAVACRKRANVCRPTQHTGQVGARRRSWYRCPFEDFFKDLCFLSSPKHHVLSRSCIMKLA